MNLTNSSQLFNKAKKVIPGGVNSPVRAFKSVGGTPVFMKKGEGALLFDEDGNQYIDYIGSWGPHLFGHQPAFINEALVNAVNNGASFGTPSAGEVEFAELFTEIVSWADMVRLVNSGTEATMSAVRAARGYTGRDKIIKFEGCYHGHADYFLIKAGSGALTLGVPTSPGVTKGTAADTLTAGFNDIESVKALTEKYKGEIAAVIVEPVAGNMGVIPGKKKFLEGLKTICAEEGIVLIFDEVMTGFRLAPGGAAELLGITPDLATYGKIIGGGMPVGAFAGKKEIMEKIAPAGPVYQAGTLSGNPVAVAAGRAVLKHIQDNKNLYDELEEKSAYLENGLKNNLKKAGKNYYTNRVGSMLCMFFTEEKVTGFSDAVKSDTEKYGRYFHKMLEKGIYLAPAQFEAMFVSTAHTREQLDKTIQAHLESLQELD